MRLTHCLIHFKGEIGGYMGLLLGCSVLTIVEFLDLVFYNLFAKIEDHHHRRQSTTPVKKKLPEDFEETYTTFHK